MNSLSIPKKNDSGSNANPFPSFASLRLTHGDLLKQYRQQEDKATLFPLIVDFICRGKLTGAFLDSDEDRLAAQSIIDYWSSTLYRSGCENTNATLDEFNPELSPSLDDDQCPYLGLDAFREKDANNFYGRQRLLTQLIETLKSSRMLAVIGASGSGKSSVVLGGLIPKLKDGALSNSDRWYYYPSIVPSINPLESLVRLIAPKEVNKAEWATQKVAQLKVNPSFLVALIRELHGDFPVVFVIDQFEEVFTLCQDKDVRQTFTNSLVALIKDPKTSQCHVILTMRSDFESQVAKLPDFQSIFETAQIRVLPLDPSELREAIEKPAEQVGLKFENGLVEALIGDVLGEPAALPLLQFTLLKLWNHRERNRITQESYKKIGGGRLTLSNSADELYNKLIPEDQVTCKRIFLKMVRPTEGLEVTSSRITLKELYLAGEASDRVERVLKKLIAARLVRQTEGNTPDDTQVEVAHEALIRNWHRLVEWLEDERVNLRQQIHLRTLAEHWQTRGRDSNLVLRGNLLREAQNYKDLNALTLEFIQFSIEVEQTKAEVEQKQREEKLRLEKTLEKNLKQRKQIIFVFIMIIIGALNVGTIFNEKQKANQALQGKVEALQENLKKDKTLQERDKALQERDKALQERNATLEGLQRANKEKAQAFEKKEEEIAKLQQENEKLREENAEFTNKPSLPLQVEKNLPNSKVAVVFDPPSNVRDSPNGSIICEISVATSINIFNSIDGWYETDYCGKVGFIHSSQIKF